MSSVESNKALVRRFYEEIDNGNINILDELVYRTISDLYYSFSGGDASVCVDAPPDTLGSFQ